MANQDTQSATPTKWEGRAFPRRRGSLAAVHRGGRWGDSRYILAYRRLLERHRRLIRRVGIAGAVIAGVLLLGCVGLWWRLSSGPIQLDLVTPWLASAIEENFGSSDRVEVGGTQIERTENGGAAVRIRNIVVRDADGTVVARAPEAEVHVSALSLLRGHVRAESLNLVRAQLHVRIEPDGSVTVFAGTGKHPIASATAPMVASVATDRARSAPPSVRSLAASTSDNMPPTAVASASPRRSTDALAAILSWIDGVGQTGLDGHDLRELGLKEGNLTVDDERSGKDWGLSNIMLSLRRPRGGGVMIELGSENPTQPWTLTASIKPIRKGVRAIEVEAHHVSAEDLLRVFHVGDGNLRTSLPLSASVRGVIGADGVPQALSGQVAAETGFIGDSDDADGHIDLGRAEFRFDWDAAERSFRVPFQILSGGNRITLLGEIGAPKQSGGSWSFKIGGGTVVFAAPGRRSKPLIFNRVAVSGSFDPMGRRLVLDRGDLGNADLNVAMSGSAAYASGAWLLNAGFAGKRMSVQDLKRLWPVFVAPKVRDWFEKRLISGTVDHITIAVNAPLDTLRAAGPPIPHNGLSVDALATGCTISPVDGLPALNDADLTVKVSDRDAKIKLGKAIARLPSGRKLVMSSGLFEVPDTAPHEPPARVRFKLDGPVQAAAELLATNRLRDVSDAPFDPATTRGTMDARVTLAMPLKPDLSMQSTDYSIAVDANDFSAEHMIMGQRLQAATLHGNATPQGFQFKGDVRIGGTAANLEYRKARGENDAEIRISSVLDATARKNFGLDPANAISGSIPIRVAGRIDGASGRNGRFAVDADLTPAQIEGFLPGWFKPAGKRARISLTLATTPQSTRIDELAIEGVGESIKGTIQLDGSGKLQSADFPSYDFSDGDKASLKAERAADGALHITLRGEVFDGRGFIRTLTGGSPDRRTGKRLPTDVDLDAKLGAVLAFNGEALSNLDLKMSRRAGEIRKFSLSAKIGHDGTLIGELRGNAGGRQAVDLKTDDAGALFRATDVYSRMVGGQMAVLMDAPSASSPKQQGTVDVRDFEVHDESELQRAANDSPSGAASPDGDLQFSSMRVDFTRAPGRMALRDGVVRGPVLGGTIDGLIDYRRDKLELRGTLVPLYGPNNLLGWIPLVGPILGGQKEGIFGFTYQVVGRPGKPVLDVNILSVLAPGVLRKIFEYPAASDSIIDGKR